jgi:CrcB protein
MPPMLLVAAGSALGGVARFAIYQSMTRLGLEGFPWGTVAVNVIGSAVIGFMAGTAPPSDVETRYFVMTGVCGGFTTFSTFSLDTLNMLRGGEWAKAAAYIAAQLGLCLAAVWLGWAAAPRK